MSPTRGAITLETVKDDIFVALRRQRTSGLIHLVLEFSTELDASILKASIGRLYEACPVLCARYVDHNPGWPYWELINEPVLTVVEEQDDGVLDTILGQPLAIESVGVISFYLIKRAHGDALVIKVSHAVSDAAGVKSIACFLASYYTEFSRDKRDETNRASRQHFATDRSLAPIYRQFSIGKKLNIWRYAIENFIRNRIPWKHFSVPVDSAPHNSPITFIRETLTDIHIDRLQAFRQCRGCTINEVLMAIIIRAMYKSIDAEPSMTIKLINTVDLRRYLKRDVIANQSSLFTLSIGVRSGDSIEDTVLKVQQHMRSHKSREIGLDAHLWHILNRRWLSYPFALSLYHSWLEVRRRLSPSNPPPVVTNMGKLEASQLCFGDVSLRHAYLLAPAAYAPLFYMGLSRFGDGIDVSIGYVKTSANDQYFRSILANVVAEIEELAERQTSS